MRTESGIEIIKHSILKPGWDIDPQDYTHRFEDTIRLNITYPALSSNREEAPHYCTPVEGGARASFNLMVGKFDDVDLYRALINTFCRIECHEWREFFRVHPTFWAPFHPHRIDGMERWGEPDHDLQFGLA